MTRLDCTVTSCMYNKEKSCCKDNIQVEGNNAKHSRDTCCSSFRERGEGNYQSSVDYPLMRIVSVMLSTSELPAVPPASAGRRSARPSGASASKVENTIYYSDSTKRLKKLRMIY